MLISRNMVVTSGLIYLDFLRMEVNLLSCFKTYKFFCYFSTLTTVFFLNGVVGWELPVGQDRRWNRQITHAVWRWGAAVTTTRGRSSHEKKISAVISPCLLLNRMWRPTRCVSRNTDRTSWFSRRYQPTSKQPTAPCKSSTSKTEPQNKINKYISK